MPRPNPTNCLTAPRPPRDPTDPIEVAEALRVPPTQEDIRSVHGADLLASEYLRVYGEYPHQTYD